MRHLTIIATLIATISIGASAGQRAPAKPTGRPTSGIALDRFKRLDTVLQEHIDQNRIAGIVALVLRDGKPIYERALGWSDKEAQRPMAVDTIFRIASQTKALTSAAILALVEDGRLTPNMPVGRFIPTFAKTTVAVKGAEGLSTVPARRAITIADLLTHTAGISYGTDALVASAYEAKGLGPAAGFGWYTADKDEETCVTMERLATLPFVAQVGSSRVDLQACKLEYSIVSPK